MRPADTAVGQRDDDLTEPSAARPGDRQFYVPELDSLRFFAFLLVLIYHSVVRDETFYLQNEFPAWLAKFLAVVPKAGNFGLDIFFALSAYLLTTLLLREKQVYGTIDVRKFYLRRMLRIWPVYFLVIGIALLTPHFDPREQMDWFHAFLFIVFLGRIAVAYYPLTTIAGPMWSVSVEEQFYLVWPWVMKQSRRTIVAVCCAILLVCYAARWHIEFAHVPRHSLESAWFWRMDPIVYGAMLGVTLAGRIPRIAIWLRYLMLAAGLVMIYIGALWADDVNSLQPIAQLFYLPIADIGCIVVLAACLGIQDRWVGGFLRLRPLVHLGRISYGLYAYHFLVLWMISGKVSVSLQVIAHRIHHGQLWYQLAMELLALSLIIIFAECSYHFMERPILRIKERFARVQSRPGG